MCSDNAGRKLVGNLAVEATLRSSAIQGHMYRPPRMLWNGIEAQVFVRILTGQETLASRGNSTTRLTAESCPSLRDSDHGKEE